MLAIPSALQLKFEGHLRNMAIPDNLHGMYQKWLRYYLDFCHKYHFQPNHLQSLHPFIAKLRDKQQSQAQQEQAVKAINLYYALFQERKIPCQQPLQRTAVSPETAPLDNKKQSAIGAGPGTRVKVESLFIREKPISGASWKSEYARLADEIHLRHYSPKTLKSYQGWVRAFQAYTHSKPPESLSTDDVKEFLIFLAVKQTMQMMPVGELPALVHVVEDRHRHAREDQGSDLAGHQRDGEPLEDRIEEDHRDPHHHHGGGGDHHGAEPHRPGVDDRLVQGHPLGDAQLYETHQDDGVSHHDPGPGDEPDHAGGGEEGAHGPRAH
nr:site-specific integrase [Desulfoglaeba alkanexedens]